MPVVSRAGPILKELAGRIAPTWPPCDEAPMREPERAVDMSPEAVARRLRELAELYRLGLSLAKARILGPVRSPKPR